MRSSRAWPLVVAAVMTCGASPRGQMAPPSSDYAAAVHAYVVGHKAASAAFHLELAIALVRLSPELAGVAQEGWHDVRVTLKAARGEVIARPGYFESPQ